VPDQMRLRALERLVAVARGQPVAYQPRLPRFLATIPAVVHGPAGPIYMTTFSVSENGCGLVWSGPVAAVTGAQLDLRLGAGSRAVVFRGVVCWTARSGTADTVGVRFVAGAKHAWTMMLGEAERSGAPPA
jgi:PilZ domain-containing protein